MATTAHDVAALLIALQSAAGREIDKMQLQKLLYLVQGANLLFWGEPAFRERVRAWRNGPVVANVETTYRVVDGNDIAEAFGGNPRRLDDQVIDTIENVLRHFGEWAGPELEAYVKGTDSPWRQARGGLPSFANSDVEIPVADIEEWFNQHGLDPDPPPVVPWNPTAADRAAADERLAQAKAFGVYAPTLSAEEIATATRALARASTEDQRID